MSKNDSDNGIKRLHTGELELGVTDALQRHITRKVVPAKPVSQRRLDFENKRPRLLRECMAEATGVFFYVLPGVAAVTAFTLATYSEAGKAVGPAAFGGLMQIALSFGFGIAFAIITCAPTSGGHFNPAVTICLTIWQGFPIRKAPLYILSQIFGAFVAGMVIMGCYWPELSAVKALNLEQHGTAVFNGGAASVLCTFPNPDQTNQGFLFFQEFMVDSFIGIVIWSCLDPANPFVTPASVPWTIGLCYSAMIMGFAGNSISTNLARDLGTRIVAAIFFGKEAFTFDNGYSWISILVNVPATIFATGYYELVLRDSLKKISSGHAAHEDGEAGLVRHLTKMENSERGYMQTTERPRQQSDEMTV